MHDETRPRILVKLTPADRLVEAAGAAGIAAMLLLPALSWHRLPIMIPVHFNLAGQPDSFGSRWMIWTLPAITGVLYAGLTILNRFPQIFNFPVKITSENAERLYGIATRMIRILKVMLVLIFLVLTTQTLNTAAGKTEGIGAWFLPATLILTLGITVVGIILMFKKK